VIRVIAESGDTFTATVSRTTPAETELAITRQAAGWLWVDTVYATLDRGAEVNLGKLPRPAVPDLPGFSIENDRIHMRAADDLAGCAAILAALEYGADQPAPGTVYGLFTRAEEVGLVGARLAAENELIPKNTVIVSVETSSVLPGAEIGNGIVIRTGDRSATFDNEAEVYLTRAAINTGSNNPGFKVQRQLMSAGGCEAAAFKAFGYKVTGTAFPLGAWHNRGESGVETEFISKGDFVGGAILLAEAAKLAGTAPRGVLDRLTDPPEEEAERLRSGRTDR
jgi:endoglucanase